MKKSILLMALCSVIFVSSQAQEKNEQVYGNNLLTLSPVMVYASPQVSDVGISISYERFVNDYVGVKIPVNLGLTNNLVQTGISAKFYPTGHRGVVRYAIAPTILYSQSSTVDYIERFNNQGNFIYTEEVDNNLRQLGFSLNNSLNVTIQRNIYVGLEMGLGLNYVNDFEFDQTNNNNFFYQNEDPNILFQFGISIGYRF